LKKPPEEILPSRSSIKEKEDSKRKKTLGTIKIYRKINAKKNR